MDLKIYNNKARIKLMWIVLFSIIFTLSFYKIYAEFNSMKKIRISVRDSLSEMSSVWTKEVRDIYIPNIDVTTPISIEYDDNIFNRECFLKVVYNPDPCYIVGNLNYDKDTAKRSYHIYVDKNNTGISANGINGTYYSVPSDELMDYEAVKRIIGNTDGYKTFFDENNPNYAKAILKMFNSVKELDLDRNQLLQNSVELFMNCRFSPAKKTYINTADGRVTAARYSFKVKMKHIASFMRNLEKCIDSNIDSNVISKIVGDINEIFLNSPDEYLYSRIIVYNDLIYSAECYFVHNTDKISFALTPDYTNGFLEANLMMNGSDKLLNLKFNPTGNGLSFSIGAKDYIIKFKCDEKELNSSVKKSKSEIFKVSLAGHSDNDNIDIKIRLLKNDTDISFTISNTEFDSEFTPALKSMDDIDIRDTMNIASLLTLVGDFRIM